MLTDKFVASAKSAGVILKLWERKYNRTADLVVIEGPKAGGHLGFKPDEVLNITHEDYKKEIADIMETVDSFGEKFACLIPVVVAGGISDHDKAIRTGTPQRFAAASGSALIQSRWQ